MIIKFMKIKKVIYIWKFFSKIKIKNNNKYSFENVCRNLEMNISVVIPFLKEC